MPGQVKPAQKTQNLRAALLSAWAALCLIAIVIFSSTTQANLFGEGPKPLPVDEAFIPVVSGIQNGHLQFEFEIADGYYLYRDKLSISGANANFAALSLPEAVTHEDEYFGTSYVYRGGVAGSAKVKTASSPQLNVALKFQGCADLGICYPPTTVEFDVDASAFVLAQATPISSAQPASDQQSVVKQSKPKLSVQDLLAGPSGNGGLSEPPLLSPQEAFIPVVQTQGSNQVTVNWNIEPGYYIYRKKMGFELLDAEGASVANTVIDEGQMQYDEFFGDVAVLRNSANAYLDIESAAPVSNATLRLHYQGCADIGVCFPPEKIDVPVSFATTAAVVASTGNGSGGGGSGIVASSVIQSPNSSLNLNASAASPAVVVAAATSASNVSTQAQSTRVATNQLANAKPVSEQDKLTALLGGGQLWVVTLAFYVAGLLLAFTACVYPMIPILSSLIVGQGDNITTARAFSLSLVYVLSMAAVYAVVGVLVGLSGFNIQPLFQNPWVLSAFAALFVLLALSMFGLFQIQMPAAIQTRLVNMSNNQKGGNWAGVSIMGMLSALIVGPCVTAPLVAALAYIANTGDAVMGGVALFAVGLGMGTPLLFIGTSAGKLLPKAGGWMFFIQRLFGLILLGVAIAMLDRFLPSNIILLLGAALGILAAVMLGGTASVDKDSSGMQLFGKSAGLIAGLYGAVLMVGALSGGNSFLKPLEHFAARSGGNVQQESEHVAFEQIKGNDGLQKVLARAQQTDQVVLLDFYADWCVSCKEMEKYTFTDKRVKDALDNVIMIQADVTKNDEQDQALLKQFGLFGPPAILLYDTEGQEIGGARTVGFVPAEKFSNHLNAYLSASN